MDGLAAGKTALVTGAAQGIGKAIAQLLRAHGANVVDLDLPGCDVTSESDWKAAVERTIREFGRVDILVNNAGITRDGSLRKMLVEDFDAVIGVSLKGSWLGIRTVADVMIGQGSGSIINISSLSGKSGNPGQTNYSAAKAGIIGLTKAAAKELAPKGIRVNAVQPGLIRTAMTLAMKPEVFAAREADIPLRRAGEPGEVANAVLFLASDLASYMTGSVLEVGGGRLM